MDEKLSQSQAKAIVDTANEIMSNLKTVSENKNTEFVNQVKKIWEDQHAVDYFAKHKDNMDGFIEELDKNNKVFGDAVETIANYYAKVGGMSAISVAKISLVPAFDVSAIKKFFADGNGDDFGFTNPASGAAQVMDAFVALREALTNAINSTVERIKAINAFGNPQVKLEIAKSAGKVVEILQSHIAQAEKLIREYVDQTAQAYVKVGTISEQAAKLTTN